MRQWIREHPWRLEIVPAALVAIAILAPRREISSHWESSPVVVAVFLLLLLAANAAENHNWVQDELDKSFNFGTVLLTMWLSVALILSLGATGAEKSMIWIAVAFSAPVLQAILEGTRRVSAKPATVIDGAPVEVNPGDKFFYREASTERIGIAGLAVLGAVAIAVGLPGRNVVLLYYGALCLLAMGPKRTVFTITNDWLTMRTGWRLKKIAMTGVIGSAVGSYGHFAATGGWYTFPGTYRGMTVLAPPKNAGSFLHVYTDTETFLIGLNKPEAASGVINAALAARQKEAEA